MQIDLFDKIHTAHREQVRPTRADSTERPYQLGALVGAAVMAVVWYVQFH